MYAVPSSYGDGSTLLMRAQCGRFGIPAVMLFQCAPPSRVTHTKPSSVPTQSSPLVIGDSAIDAMVSYTSVPALSRVIGSPDGFCLFLSLRVRSGLTAAHVAPPSSVFMRYCAPK